MKVEMDLYLGRDGDESKTKIKKHVEGEQWLKAHLDELKRLIKEPATFKVIPLISPPKRY